ncbi:uncharacterized protein LOC127750764 [Frankliniella occidentalis]|uniref:Uncharacterized protein LOC127750764 n=1 Tax=Frankliniella occidentalis TaxID=133901 RepID=A0A9C6XSB2_FRAOC|nr:uncharacterized protein LOC127750764 [Frankliniella occidentalis]
MARPLSAAYIRGRAYALARRDLENDEAPPLHPPLQAPAPALDPPQDAAQEAAAPEGVEIGNHAVDNNDDDNSNSDAELTGSDSDMIDSSGASGNGDENIEMDRESENNGSTSDGNNTDIDGQSDDSGRNSDDDDDSDNIRDGDDDMPDSDDDMTDSDDDDYDYDNRGNDSDDDRELLTRLAKWSLQYSITLEATTALLAILRDDHPELPKTAECLRRTSKRRLEVKELDNGQYVHLGFDSLFSGIDPTRVEGGVLEIDFGIDGLSIFKSTGTECWPILARCVAGDVVAPVVIGIFYGRGKPTPIRRYLQDLIDNIQELSQNGVVIGNRRFEVSVRCFICDALGRAYLRCCKANSALNGCEKCDQEGYKIGHITVFQTVSGVLRTNDSFRNQNDPDHHNAISPLLDLDIDLVLSFPLDPMHLVELGVIKRFVDFILERGNLNIRLSPLQRHLFDTFMIEVARFLPCEFKRKSRSLTLMSRYKAVEWRLLLLYLGIIIFSRILHPQLYRCFLLLHASCFIMSNDVLIHNFLPLCQNYLENFVAFSSAILGPTFVAYNVHNLLHLVSDVQLYGNLMSFSAYPFENELRHLKRLAKSAPLPLQQICKRVIERNRLHVKRRKKQIRGFQMPHEEGPVAHLENVVRQFCKYECEDFTLRRRRPDNCVSFRNGQIGLVRNIVECVNNGLSSFHVVVRVYSTSENLYDYPLESSLLGIFKVSNLTPDNFVFNIGDISHKCLLIPSQGSNVCIPLLHNFQ